MEFVPLAERARILFHLQALSSFFFFWIPATTVTSVGAVFFISPLYVAIGAIGWLFFLFVLALWFPSLSFDRWGYLLRDEDLVITRGVLFRIVAAIPVHRIQHVDTRQGPLEQWMGLARVQIYTASGMGADGVIPGLDVEVAEALRDELVRVAEGDDGV